MRIKYTQRRRFIFLLYAIIKKMKRNILIFSVFIAVTAMGSELDLGMRVKPLPPENRFGEEGFFVWCGAPVKGPDNKYHLFYSRWPVKRGFAPGWALASEIAYAVAERPQGPYKPVNVALPPRGVNPKSGKKYWDADVTHNANALYHKGRYYIFYMGNYGDGKTYPLHRNNQRIGVAYAEKPEGPWTRPDEPSVDVSPDKAAFDSLMTSNPAGAIRPDGGAIIVYKAVTIVDGKPMGGQVRHGVAFADKPEGPYVKQKGNVFESDKGGKHSMVAEDPFIWYSKKYGDCYYALTRDVVGLFTGASGGIALFTSQDGLNWVPAKYPKVLGKTFTLADGTQSDSRIERPALLIEDDEPVLFFGATDGYLVKGKISTNVQIPLK
jgi:hypothetical protein